MSSSVAAPKPTCSELQVEHPPNDAATCWWLSVNFALFHKKRPELDAYFSDSTNVSSIGKIDRAIINKFKLTSEIKQNYKNIYDHYTNTKTIDIKDLKEYRLHKDMKDAFNVSGTDPFVINGSSNQPAEEYLLKLTEYIPFSGGIPPLVIKGENEYNGQCYDLYIHKQYYGSTTEKFQLNYTNTHTVMISFKRKPFGGKIISDEIKLLEKIMLPLIDPANRPSSEKTDLNTSYRETLTLNKGKTYNEDQIKEMVGRRDYSSLREIPITDKQTLKENLKLETFSLDAIVEATGSHFNTYVKCGETGQWGFYDAISGGKINKDLVDFNKLPADLVKRATILFYTREGTATPTTPPPPTSLPLPAPLPGPPGSGAPPAAGVPAPLPAPPGGVPEPLPAPPDVGAPAPLPAPPGGVPEPLPAPPGGVPEPLPEPPGLAGDAPPVLPEPPEPLPAPPAAAAAAAAVPLAAAAAPPP